MTAVGIVSSARPRETEKKRKGEEQEKKKRVRKGQRGRGERRRRRSSGSGVGAPLLLSLPANTYRLPFHAAKPHVLRVVGAFGADASDKVVQVNSVCCWRKVNYNQIGC
jgi:hypothetical protein